jgi:hypothetical protein
VIVHQDWAPWIYAAGGVGIIVIAQHTVHRRRENGQRIGNVLIRFGFAVVRQITGEEDDIRILIVLPYMHQNLLKTLAGIDVVEQPVWFSEQMQVGQL